MYVVPESIQSYSPYKRLLKIPRGRGISKAKLLEEKYEAKLEYPGGGVGAKQKTFNGGRMGTFYGITQQNLCMTP